MSVSGVGIYRCRDEAELRQALDKFEDDVPIQLQEEVKAEAFLNLQYRVIGKDVVRLLRSWLDAMPVELDGRESRDSILSLP